MAIINPLIISLLALVMALIAIVLNFIHNRKLKKLETLFNLNKNMDIFDRLISDHLSGYNKDDVLELGKEIKDKIIKKFGFKPSVTYMELLKELYKKGFPSDIMSTIEDFFIRVMRLEYSGQYNQEDLDYIVKEAKLIVKTLELNQKQP